MTDIKSILVHLDSSERCAERIRVASLLSRNFNATVTGVYAVIPSLLRYPLGLEGADGALGLLEYDDERRERAQRLWNSLAGESPMMHWGASLDGTIGDFERKAFYTDLIVVGQRDADDPAAVETPSDFILHQVRVSGRPVLLVPCAGTFPQVGKTVLIAWKETREAARAVSAAMPWLRMAEHVHAICYANDDGASLQALRHYLAQHEVTTTLHHEPNRDVDVGVDLLSRVADIGADLLVLGCYGHSRMREWVLGGVSRTILHSMTLPVLMAH